MESLQKKIEVFEKKKIHKVQRNDGSKKTARRSIVELHYQCEVNNHNKEKVKSKNRGPCRVEKKGNQRKKKNPELSGKRPVNHIDQKEKNKKRKRGEAQISAP